MKKYLAVARITIANIFEYRWEYLISQLRWILFLVTLYFLWNNIFISNRILFGFKRIEILNYVFLAAILRQFVISSATDQIAGEIQNWGKFFSYFLKPIGYFRYWFTVDVVYKIVNVSLILIIIVILAKIFDVVFIRPETILGVLLFLTSAFIGMLMYFYIGILVSTSGFWTSQVWGLQFLMVLVLEFAAGSYFPIDVLPTSFQSIIKLTPFPYLLYFPINIFLGRLTLLESIRVIMVAALWLVLIYSLTIVVWKKGLKAYEAWGG